MSVYAVFPEGKRKVFTLSYDDGWPQDEKLIALMNKYGIKGTFNLVSGDVLFDQIENPVERYKGQEVAAHGHTHGYLGRLAPAQATYDVLKNREALEKVFGGTVRGFAYGHGSYNDETKQILKNCGIKYARTINNTEKFLLPQDWFFFDPTCEDLNPKLLELADRFYNMKPQFTQVHMFYIWGHSHFTDRANHWDKLEEVFRKMGNNEEIWCATNIEIYDYMEAFRNLIMSADGTYIYNPTNTTLWLMENNGDFMSKHDVIVLKPGEEVYLK